MYPSKWPKDNGEAAFVDGELTAVAETWRAGLYGITPDQVGDGFSRCLTKFPTWPPTVQEFRQLCLPERPSATAAHQEYARALPRPPADPVKVAGALSGLRASTSPRRGARRSVMLPREGYGDYIEALGKFVTAGLGDKRDFDWIRLEANGWTRAEEAALPEHLKIV